MTPDDLRARRVLVTGGSRGIGTAPCEQKWCRRKRDQSAKGQPKPVPPSLGGGGRRRDRLVILVRRFLELDGAHVGSGGRRLGNVEMNLSEPAANPIEVVNCKTVGELVVVGGRQALAEPGQLRRPVVVLKPRDFEPWEHQRTDATSYPIRVAGRKSLHKLGVFLRGEPVAQPREIRRRHALCDPFGVVMA